MFEEELCLLDEEGRVDISLGLRFDAVLLHPSLVGFLLTNELSLLLSESDESCYNPLAEPIPNVHTSLEG